MTDKKSKKSSRRGIEKILFYLFYDEASKEYSGSTLSRNFIQGQVSDRYPNVDFQSEIYPIFTKWQNKYNNLYDTIYDENQRRIVAGFTDTREQLETKYQIGLYSLKEERIAPVFFDHDTGNYKVALNLKMYEEFMSEKIRSRHELLYNDLIALAKRGGTLMSGIDSRQLVFDVTNERKRYDLINKSKVTTTDETTKEIKKDSSAATS